MPPIQDHPLRYGLTNELHARPFPQLQAPATAAYLAIKPEHDAVKRDRALDLAHLTDLLDRHGAPHPQPGATHYFGQIGRHHLKWESHTEFVTYTILTDGVSDRAFDPADFEVFPQDWLEQAPGLRITSALIRITPWSSKEQLIGDIAEWFVSESVAVSRVLDDAAVLAGDFRVDPAGHLRFALSIAPETGVSRTGRIVQRICEIETYKTMSMLGFARVREMGAQMGAVDDRLNRLTAAVADGDQAPDEALEDLLTISAELEGLVAQSTFRLSATVAYEKIVNQRIEMLREARFNGRQTFSEFMMRRYEPAMRTVLSARERLEAMSARAGRTAQLLRTKVDVARSAQNQALLESMDRRADLQLRLQKTVEGLSVVAISYYAVSLASYLLYPLAERLDMSKGMLMALVTVPIVLAVWGMVRTLRNKVD